MRENQPGLHRRADVTPTPVRPQRVGGGGSLELRAHSRLQSPPTPCLVETPAPRFLVHRKSQGLKASPLA